MTKRLMDLFVAGFALLLLALPMLLLAILVAFKLGRPVLFRQDRPGITGRPFTLLKFRTMTNARGENGRLLTDAQRLTAFGRFLRSTSLDELPELWNVLRGDMSLVGPRPLLMEYLSLYTPEQGKRHNVRPGITGWAQVNGRNTLSWEERFALDTWYVENRSFFLDCKIILITMKKVIYREGINQEGSATMEKFSGTEGSGPRT